MQFVKQTIQNFFRKTPKPETSSRPPLRIDVAASDIAFAIVDTSDSILDPMAASICRNLSEFWIIEVEMRGHKVLIDSSMDSVLRAAAASPAKYVVCSSLGGVYSAETEFFDEIKKWISANSDFYLAGHILDRKDKWYELHDQCFVLNLEKYRALGCPSYGPYQRGEFEVAEVERSVENFHDDYTPHWIRPTGEMMTVQRVERGHGLLNAGLKAGYEIKAFSEPVRAAKYFFYPTVQGEFSRKLAWWETQSRILFQGFYTFNTEHMKYPVGEKPKPIRRLITLSSGLLFFEILKSLDFESDTSIYFYDNSPSALHLMRQIALHWDGVDYPQFLRDNVTSSTSLLNFFEPEKKWSEFQDRFGGPEGWQQFFKRVKDNCRFYFSDVNVFSDQFHRQPFFEDFPQEGETLLWLSNVFHYRYSSALRSLEDRVRSQDSLMDKLKAVHPKMLIHMTSALGHRIVAGRVFRVEEYEPQIDLVPRFWTARSSRYPVGVRNFFLNHGASEAPPPRIPARFKHIQLENLSEISEPDLVSFSKWIEFESHIPWLKMDLNIPHADMLREAQSCLADFVPHRADYSSGWSSLTLHGISASHTEDYDRYGYKKREEAPYRWTEIAEKCPVTTNWLTSQWPMQQFDRIRYMLLRPGGLILPHNDMDGRRGLSAINVALNQPPGCEMVFEKYGLVPWASGDVRRLDVGVNHSVYNGSNELRYHMIIHGRVGDRFKDWNRIIVQSFLKSNPQEH